MATLPNGLTDDDQRYCFEMASSIWTDQATISIHNGYSIQLSLSDVDTLQNDLAGRLVNLSSGTVIMLQVLIYGTDDGLGWVQCRKGQMEQQNGGSDSVTGLSWSIEGQRQSIIKLFDGYVGCIHMVRALARKKDEPRGQSSSICVMRG